MCGITGIVDLCERRPIEGDVLKAMNGRLSHRGPDGDGFHFSPGVGLGHRRLSIIDLAGGKQPLNNEDLSVVVTFNGEIFNFAEIAQELAERGHVFRTRCDTEVIVHAWEEWGERCLRRFNGMFAFALWDERQQVLFAARDRLGVKPLYYAELSDGHLAFASELKALLVHTGVRRAIDPLAVEEYLAFGYVPDPKTIYTGVRKLEAGTYLRLQRGRGAVTPTRYWDVPLAGSHRAAGPADQWPRELRDRLKESVRKRLMSDVPLGAFLSGGIDSSAVVAMMRELGEGRILTCSIGFREREYDESHYAELVATAKKTDHRTELVAASDYSLLDTLVATYDEPFADSSAMPTYRVCQLARRFVTVALSGDGGDEDFVGYRRYQLLAAEEALRRRVPQAIRRGLLGPLGRVYPRLDWAPRLFRARATLQSLNRDTVGTHFHWVSVCKDDVRRDLYSARFRRELQDYNARDVLTRYVGDQHFSDPLSLAQYLDYKTYLPGDILTKVDRASMAHGLEVRTPFLDYEFVEWAAGLPADVKLRHREGKYILKESLRPVLPHDVLFRKKMGFAVPLESWFRGPLGSRVAELAHSERLRQSEIFDPDALGALVKQHNQGRRDHSAALWALLMFDGFLRQSDRSGDLPSTESLHAGMHQPTRHIAVTR